MSTLKAATAAVLSSGELLLRVLAHAYSDASVMVEILSQQTAGEDTNDAWWSVRCGHGRDAEDQQQLNDCIQVLDQMGLIKWNSARSCVQIRELQP